MTRTSLLSSLLVLLVLTACRHTGAPEESGELAPLVLSKSKKIVEQDGRKFRDLNGNGQLDLYEDAGQAVDERVEDLLSQMTLEEKAGLMFIEGAPVSEDGRPEGRVGLKGPAVRLPTVVENMEKLKLKNFNIWEIPGNPEVMARWYNEVQLLAEQSRLGIPVTIFSDPRHHFSKNIFSIAATGFSQFCETLGFAAIGDEELMRQFAEVARREYLAVGIRGALHPQVDLATEPRWARINGGFGEDAELSAKLVRAYIEGMQGGKELTSQGVACMVKHFPGGGPQKDGLDPHFGFHQGQIYPGRNFDYHLIPFQAAFEANVASVMPYYGVPMDQTDENVGMAFNKQIITGLLREKYGYDGIVCTDWGLITDTQMGPEVVWEARAWGVEHLSEAERVLKVLDAGCDQFGGEDRVDLIVQLVQESKLSEERIDVSARRILREKFQLGLFDDPFVDETQVSGILAQDEAMELGERSQQQAMTLLKNDDNRLPLPQRELKAYVENLDSSVVAEYATVVSKPGQADLAIIRLSTPWYPVETNNPFALGFHHGDLDFKGAEKARILTLLQTVPTVVDIYLDRPAVIPEIAAAAKALIADYGATDRSVCEVLFGNSAPLGKLPFELPSSMEAVQKQKADLPHDSQDPLYAYGFGLRYAPSPSQ